VIAHFELGPLVDYFDVYADPAHAAYGEALAAAVEQRGPALVLVICDPCGNKTIATLSQRPAGLFYESLWEEPIPPGEQRLRAEAKHTDPASPLARRGRFINGSRGLLDHPGFPAVWHAVQARCDRHGGVGIEIADIITVAAQASPGCPVRVRVSPTG
jgi:hypothetical protein